MYATSNLTSLTLLNCPFSGDPSAEADAGRAEGGDREAELQTWKRPRGCRAAIQRCCGQGDIYIMMKCLCVCLWVTKNHHFLLEVSCDHL